MENDRIKSITDSILEMHRSLRVEVKIPHDEVDRLIVNRLISIRNAEGNGLPELFYFEFLQTFPANCMVTVWPCCRCVNYR